jgi:hypothetical protein
LYVFLSLCVSLCLLVSVSVSIWFIHVRVRVRVLCALCIGLRVCDSQFYTTHRFPYLHGSDDMIIWNDWIWRDTRHAAMRIARFVVTLVLACIISVYCPSLRRIALGSCSFRLPRDERTMMSLVRILQRTAHSCI